jgi:hypothetical protein
MGSMDPRIVGIELALSAMLVAMLDEDAYLIRAVGRVIGRLCEGLQRMLARDSSPDAAARAGPARHARRVR